MGVAKTAVYPKIIRLCKAVISKYLKSPLTALTHSETLLLFIRLSCALSYASIGSQNIVATEPKLVLEADKKGVDSMEIY